VVVWARTPDDPAGCPGCGVASARVHSYHWRTVIDVPLDERPVTVNVQVRRLFCPAHALSQGWKLLVRASRIISVAAGDPGSVRAMARSVS
jgi:transposase